MEDLKVNLENLVNEAKEFLKDITDSDAKNDFIIGYMAGILTRLKIKCEFITVKFRTSKSDKYNVLKVNGYIIDLTLAEVCVYKEEDYHPLV